MSENGVLKKKDLFRLREGLKAVGDYKGSKFSYAVVKTLRKIEVEVADIQKTNVWSDEYKEFEKERMKIATQYAMKDKDGNPITFQEGTAIKFRVDDADQDECNAAIDELKEKYADAVKEQEEKDRDFEKLLEEPACTKLHTVPEDVVPKEITPRHMNGIFEMIEH
jgi:hypothetical protein